MCVSTNRRRAAGKFRAFLSASVCAAVLAGCGTKDGLDRREVRGTVTYDGEPLEDGSITLYPLNQGPVSYGKVQNGKFVIEKADGPIPGEYRVEITGNRETGRILTINEPGRSEPLRVPETVPVVPRQYNDLSKLTLTVPEENVVVEQDFLLEKPDSPE